MSRSPAKTSVPIPAWHTMRYSSTHPCGYEGNPFKDAGWTEIKPIILLRKVASSVPTPSGMMQPAREIAIIAKDSDTNFFIFPNVVYTSVI